MSAISHTSHLNGAIAGLPPHHVLERDERTCSSSPRYPTFPHNKGNSHTSRASRNLPSLLQAINFPRPMSFGLTDHIVIVVRLASGADEKRGTEERGGAGPDLLHFGDRVGEGCGVDENLLIKSK